ncbi:MAG: molybdenum cofactor biosynthesis protein MoaE [Chitinophagales bacterium]|nr:molybdenum cofactor biosynthesis protein MoaE [Chitinophagales bacterium]
MPSNKKQVFFTGEILPEKIAVSIAKHSSKKDIGAHSIFLGQVRDDLIDGKKVVAIEYSCYEEMANEILYQIREATFSKFELSCMHIYHSLGRVDSGKISLFVFTSSKHRKMAIDACTFVVEEIKSKAPIWGKEIFEDETYVWKQNQNA